MPSCRRTGLAGLALLLVGAPRASGFSVGSADDQVLKDVVDLQIDVVSSLVPSSMQAELMGEVDAADGEADLIRIFVNAYHRIARSLKPRVVALAESPALATAVDACLTEKGDAAADAACGGLLMELAMALDVRKSAHATAWRSAGAQGHVLAQAMGMALGVMLRVARQDHLESTELRVPPTVSRAQLVHTLTGYDQASREFEGIMKHMDRFTDPVRLKRMQTRLLSTVPLDIKMTFLSLVPKASSTAKDLDRDALMTIVAFGWGKAQSVLADLRASLGSDAGVLGPLRAFGLRGTTEKLEDALTRVAAAGHALLKDTDAYKALELTLGDAAMALRLVLAPGPTKLMSRSGVLALYKMLVVQ